MTALGQAAGTAAALAAADNKATGEIDIQALQNKLIEQKSFIEI